MPERPPIDRHDPSFFRFPLNNSRTGFRPFFLPLVLVEPNRRTSDGFPVGGSAVFNTRFFIADAPMPARVAGPFNTGLLIPQTDLFTLDVSTLDLAKVQISLSGQPFFDGETGVAKTFEEAKEGDVFAYALLENGSTATDIPFLPDANYYDLSTFKISVEDLPRPERYFFVWEVGYNVRVLSSDNEFICTNDEQAIAQFKQEVAHPGEIHHEMFKKTPDVYFDTENITLEKSKVLQFYRPFADMLQDIFDETKLIDGINFVDKIPAQLIPYLAFLIGWDLPNFPGVSDNIRRSILKQATRLQQLKGSRRALIDLFDIFGFSIQLLNLWFSKDGSRLIAPGETLPEELQDEEIELSESCQTDVLVSEFSEAGFGQIEIPLLFRPNLKLVLDAWLVTTDSPTRDALADASDAITDDAEAFATEVCATTADGFLVPQKHRDSKRHRSYPSRRRTYHKLNKYRV